jgi:flagellar hook protein FlgE
MSDGKKNMFSRDGAFDLALDGSIASPASGLKVMGWQANPLTGVITTTTPPTNVVVPIGAGMIGKISSTLTVNGNLDANTVIGPPTTVPLSTTVYDAQGNAIPVTMTFTKSAANTWGWVPTTTAPGVTVAAVGPTALTFNGTGMVATGGTGNMTFTLTGGATTPEPIVIDFSKMTQLASTPSDLSSSTDGASAGSLTSFTVGQAGDITGIYSNGFKQPLGQIAMATFTNPSGLVKAGGNLFQVSPNSGNANIGVPAVSGRGTIATGFLEGSNVDLAQQFTNMIMAERGFQANSKVITVSDEMLMDLVNLKH